MEEKQIDVIKFMIDKYSFAVQNCNDKLIAYEKLPESLITPKGSYKRIDPSLYINNRTHYFVSKLVEQIVKTTSITDLNGFKKSIESFYNHPRIRIYFNGKSTQDDIINMMVKFFNERYKGEFGDCIVDPSSQVKQK